MTRAERWVRLSLDRSLRVRALHEPTGAQVLELQVVQTTLKPGEVPTFAVVTVPLGRARDLAKALTSIAGELGVRP